MSESYKQHKFNELYKQLQQQSKQNQKLMKKFRKFEEQVKEPKSDRTKNNVHQDTIDTDNQYLSKITHLLVLFSTGLNSKPMLKELHRCIEELLLEYNPQNIQKYVGALSIDYNRNLITNTKYVPMYNIWNYVIKLCKHTQLLEPRYINKRLPNLFKMLQEHSGGTYMSSGADVEIKYNFLDHINRYISNALQQYIVDRKHDIPAEVIAWKTKQLYIYTQSKLTNTGISSMLYDSVKYIYKHPNQHASRTHCNSINKIYEISQKYERSYMKQFTYYSLIRRAEKACNSKQDVEKLDKDLRHKLNKRLLNNNLYK